MLNTCIENKGLRKERFGALGKAGTGATRNLAECRCLVSIGLSEIFKSTGCFQMLLYPFSFTKTPPGPLIEMTNETRISLWDYDSSLLARVLCRILNQF